MARNSEAADLLIVGGGMAAGELGFRLRQVGFEGSIALVSDERHLPYHRPPLSKGFLAGEVEEATLLLRSAEAYAKAGICVTLGRRATRVDRLLKQVGLSDGSSLGYGKLVLATGGRPRRLSVLNCGLDGICSLRTLDDVTAIRGRLGIGSKLVLVGGGYVGLEVAAVSARRQLDVTVIEAAPRLLSRVAGPEISHFYEQLHRAAGVRLRTGATVVGFEPDPARPSMVGAVVLEDGSRVAADVVVAGIGLIPNVELATDCGLKTEDGVWVDEYCRTEDPDVLSIGDCANHPNAFYGRRIRLESVPNASEQVRVAAETLCGRLSPYAALPWFWSDQYGIKLQSVGLSTGYERAVVRGRSAEGAFSVFYLNGDTIIAADCVNRVADFVQARRLVGSRMPTDAASLMDETIPLKRLPAAIPA